MKQVTQLLTALTIVVGMMLTIGCEPDPVEPTGPSIALVSLNGADITADTVDLGASFVVNISSLQGDVPLSTIEVRENNVAVDPSRIVFDGFAAQSNPNPVGGVANLSWDIEVTADSVTEGTSTYTIIVVDENAKTASASLDITTVDPGTPVTERTMILLLNAAGPAGQGGLDLETGDQTGTTPAANWPDTDLKDMGIDINLPNDQNWKQQIAGMNSTELKTPAAGVVYDDVATVEEIIQIFEAGMTVVDQTEAVAEGDVFVAKTKEGNYFLINTTKITVVTTDNSDSYEFAVKGL
jgi:hypothetical protein